MNNNKVSIIIPTYNRPEYLNRLLKSIQRQTYKGFEVIVVDDNSKNQDKYDEVISKYTKVFREFKFIKNKTNRGAPYSRNVGIIKAKYSLVALVDDDDEWMPEKLEEQIKVFNNNKDNVGIVYTWADVIKENNYYEAWYKCDYVGAVKSQILDKCFIPSPTVMIKKVALLSAGLFDESMPSCQDWDMWIRIIFKGYKVAVVKKSLAIYHDHGNARIGNSNNAKLGYTKVYIKHFFKFLRYFKYKRIKHLIKLNI